MIKSEKPTRQPIGLRNGLKIFKPLKAKQSFKIGKPLRKISDKQKKKNATWKQNTDEKAQEQGFICSWCGLPGKRDAGFNCLTGHHIQKRRYGDNTKANDYVCHWLCHDFIETHSIDVAKYPNKQVWESRDKDSRVAEVSMESDEK